MLHCNFFLWSNAFIKPELINSNAVVIDRDTRVNSEFIPVIDRGMINQSVLPTHHASTFPAKGTCVVKMAARIEAGDPVNTAVLTVIDRVTLSTVVLNALLTG